MKPDSVCPAAWKKILACTDGSEEGQNAVAVALDLARLCRAKICVLQVLEIVPEYDAVAPDLRAFLAEEISARMESVAIRASDLGADLETLVVESQQPYAAIVAEAERLGAELMVMGRTGRTGLARLLLGSVTARVIGHSPVDVLVVPQDQTLGFQRLLIASDGSASSAAAWKKALDLARQAGSRLFALCAAREEGEIIEATEIVHQLRLAANAEGLPLTGLSPQGQQPDDAIVQEAIRNGVDLIIMGSHGRTGLSKLLLGSVTERVIGQAPCPVLVVKKR